MSDGHGVGLALKNFTVSSKKKFTVPSRKILPSRPEKKVRYGTRISARNGLWIPVGMFSGLRILGFSYFFLPKNKAKFAIQYSVSVVRI